MTKPIFGLLLITLCSTAWGKTYEEYVKEAQSKSKACQIYEETKLKNDKADREQSKNYLAEYKARLTEEGNLGSACGKDMVQYLPPEALPLMEAHKKAFIAERVAAGTMNPDGTYRKPTVHNEWFSWKKTKNSFMGLLESTWQSLLWPIGIITVLLGLMLITQPREFTRMVFAFMQGIATLIFKKKNKI